MLRRRWLMQMSVDNSNITIKFLTSLDKCDPLENVPVFFIQYTIFLANIRIMTNVKDTQLWLTEAAVVLEKNTGEDILGPEYSSGSITFWLFGLGQAITSGLLFSSVKMPFLKISVASDNIKWFWRTLKTSKDHTNVK